MMMQQPTKAYLQTPKIIIAPDSFKGALSALEVAKALKQGMKEQLPEADFTLIPMADGGEGTVDAMLDALNAKRISVEVKNPIGKPHIAHYALSPNGVAVMEMAAASGLPLLTEEERNPLKAHSFGTGEMLLDALNRGAREFILGIGGSATNDAGAGMLAALGVRFLDKSGKLLEPSPYELKEIASIDLSGLDPRLAECTIRVACDVDNPLLGPRGASHIFGPQKGATEPMVVELDTILKRFAQCAMESDIPCKRVDETPFYKIPGAGAAGGMGAALMGFLGAELLPGVELIAESVDLLAQAKGADLILTGEGRLDHQTLFGKTPMGVLAVAKAHNIPIVAIGGSIETPTQPLLDAGFMALFSTNFAPQSLQEAMGQTAQNLTEIGAQIARLFFKNSPSM